MQFYWRWYIQHSDATKQAQLQYENQHMQWYKYMLLLTLLRLSKSAWKPRFFCKTEPHRNCGFRLSIDSFGFSISNWPSSRVLTVPVVRRAARHGCNSSRRRCYTIKVRIAVGAISRAHNRGGWGLSDLNEWSGVGKKWGSCVSGFMQSLVGQRSAVVNWSPVYWPVA